MISIIKDLNTNVISGIELSICKYKVRFGYYKFPWVHVMDGYGNWDAIKNAGIGILAHYIKRLKNDGSVYYIHVRILCLGIAIGKYKNKE